MTISSIMMGTIDVQQWTFILVGLTFAIYIGIAIWSRANSTKEFYVAGSGVSPWANGMATAADWMSAASFIGMAGIISYAGYDGAVYLMGWTGGYVLLALLLWPVHPRSSSPMSRPPASTSPSRPNTWTCCANCRTKPALASSS